MTTIAVHFVYGSVPYYACSAHRFTGKERDSESGLDNFGARYNASSLGRFMTPDWSAKPQGVPYALLGDPQSLNLYAYARNNPTSLYDPDGHCWSWAQALCNFGQRINNYAFMLPVIRLTPLSRHFDCRL